MYPSISTDRLLLRPFDLADAVEMFRLNADPEVMRYVPDAPFSTVKDALQFLEDYDAYQRYGFGRWAVLRREDSCWLGWCGLRYSEAEDQVDLGFRFHRSYWGNGYATEAAKASLDWGFSERQLQRIIGRTAAENLGSRRVLEKIGMQLVGTFSETDWSGVEYCII